MSVDFIEEAAARASAFSSPLSFTLSIEKDGVSVRGSIPGDPDIRCIRSILVPWFVLKHSRVNPLTFQMDVITHDLTRRIR